MKIQEVMTSPAVTCRPEDTLNTAARLMWEHDCGAIPVVDEEGELVGMLTDRDTCMAAYTRGTVLSAIPVQDAMAKQVFSSEADDSLEMAERLMSEKQVRRLPVLDGDARVIGVVSLNDIARYAVSAGRGDGLERELTRTLAAICAPRVRAQPPEPEPKLELEPESAVPA